MRPKWRSRSQVLKEVRIRRSQNKRKLHLRLRRRNKKGSQTKSQKKYLCLKPPPSHNQKSWGNSWRSNWKTSSISIVWTVSRKRQHMLLYGWGRMYANHVLKCTWNNYLIADNQVFTSRMSLMNNGMTFSWDQSNWVLTKHCLRSRRNIILLNCHLSKGTRTQLWFGIWNNTRIKWVIFSIWPWLSLPRPLRR